MNSIPDGSPDTSDSGEKQEIARKYYRELVENSQLGMAIYIPGQSLIYTNSRLAEITGYTSEEISSPDFDFLTLWREEDRKEIRANSERRLSGEEIGPYEMPLITKIGSEKWVEINNTITEYDGRPAIQVQLLDIHRRKVSEMEILESKEKFERIFSSVAEGITISDLAGIIQETNDCTLDMLRVKSREEIIGRSAFDFIAPFDYTRAVSNLQNTLNGGVVRDIEYTFVRPDGTAFFGELSACLLYGRKRSPIGFIAVIRDTTERKALLEQLILNDRLASIGQLVSGVAHEINNPLTTIIGFSDLLLDQQIDEKIGDDIQAINEGAHRIEQIVESLITFAHTSHSEKLPSDIHRIIDTVLQVRRYDQDRHGITATTNFAEGLPEVYVNRAAIQQAIFNILVNAEYFLQGVQAERTICVSTECAGNLVRVNISDNGPGIAREDIDRLFLPFFTTKDIGQGPGLGLSICHGIVSEHQGTISVESEEGEGTTFVIELPACCESPD